MDSLHLRLASSGGFPPGRPVVVLNDEAGMNPTRLFEALAAHADGAGAKYVAAGDSRQLPAVAAGGAFAALAADAGTLTLDRVRRQRDPEHRRALALLRAGDTDAYVRWQLERDLLRIGPHEEMVAEATRAWAEAQEGLPWGQAVLLARSNDLRAALNTYARAEARARGWVHGPSAEAGSREYRAGDRVIARRNDRDLDTDNGDRGTVVEVRPRRGEVVVRTDDGRRVTYPPGYLAAGLLEHAYALTGHGAQGATLERAIRVARPEEHSREWTYTADSREREPSATFLVDAPPAEEAAFGEEGHGPIGFGVLRQDALGRYARALARSEAPTLASDQRHAGPETEPESALVENRRRLRAGLDLNPRRVDRVRSHQPRWHPDTGPNREPRRIIPSP